MRYPQADVLGEAGGRGLRQKPVTPARLRKGGAKPVFGSAAWALAFTVVALVHNAILRRKPTGDLPTDFPGYWHLYQLAERSGLLEYLALSRFEPGYQFVAWVCSNLGLDFYSFVFLGKLAFLGAVFVLFACVAGSQMMAGFATLAVAFTPLFASYTENVLRQGLAVAVLFLAGAALLRGSWRRFLVLSCLACLFHLTSLIFLGLLWLASWRRLRLGPVAVVVSVAVLGYVFDVWRSASAVLFALLRELGLEYARYGLFVDYYEVGFKAPFLGLSLLLVAFVWLSVRGCAGAGRVVVWAKFALLVTATYMLLSGFPYYDRIAAPSWFQVPIFGLLAARREFRP